MEVQVIECVNSEFLELGFIGLRRKDFKIDFFEDTLKPALLTIPEIKEVTIRSSSTERYAKVLLEMNMRGNHHGVCEKIQPILQRVLNHAVHTEYKELKAVDYL